MESGRQRAQSRESPSLSRLSGLTQMLLSRSALRLGTAAAVMFAILVILFAFQTTHTPSVANPPELGDPPELRAINHTLSLTLQAAITKDGKNAFYFNGQPIAPTLRLSPGDELKIAYVNNLPAKPSERCAIRPCMHMTNLHFHGLAVSPAAPQDDVLTMSAMPGQVLNYLVQIPRNHPPGLYWYHTHPHGESYEQVLDGMSGAIVIEGIDSYLPAVARLPERILVLRGRSLDRNRRAGELKGRVELDGFVCGNKVQTPNEVFTVNGSLRPSIAMAPDERQFWRIVNASADRYLDLELEDQTFEIVAMDGMPIVWHDAHHPTRAASHMLLPPAGRLEAIVTGPVTARPRRLISRCVDTGADGDPNPGMILADIVPGPGEAVSRHAPTRLVEPTRTTLDLAEEEKAPARFVVKFSEDKNGFYINGEKFVADAPPAVVARVGTYQHWKIVNDSKELHPMHIHQVHFLAFAEDGQPIADPLWLDTVNVPYGKSIDVIMDFTDPVIRGMSVFHCHLLNHEDKGMMAKILFE